MQGLSDIVSIVGPLSCCELASPATPCKHRLFIFESMQVYQQRACQPCLQLAQTFPNNRIMKMECIFDSYVFCLLRSSIVFKPSCCELSSPADIMYMLANDLSCSCVRSYEALCILVQTH
jgi:hypothetical protein